jgi:hypothetical protein
MRAALQPGILDYVATLVLVPKRRVVLTNRPKCPTSADSVLLQALRANVGRNQVGSYRLPIHFVRHDRVKAIAYGAIVSGTIEQPGAHDVYTFQAKAGDIIQVAGKGCELNNMFMSVIYPSGSDVLGPACREGAVTKVFNDGTYQLVVNFANVGTGHYQFVFQGASSK